MSKPILAFFICGIVSYIIFNFSQFPYLAIGTMLFGGYYLITNLLKQIK
jgi:hypothetical protein